MSTVRANSILDSSGGNTATINGMTPTAQSLQGFRNRIINGDMRIDQRNNGASVATSGGVYVTDRFFVQAQTGTVNASRSTVAPAGFVNSLSVTVATGASPASGAINVAFQGIEGFNIADLGWGTASAQTVTLSFWVRSSVTGTYAASVRNAAVNRSFVAPYTVNAANTWEYKTVSIPGETSGTWLTDNGAGIYLSFDLGEGSSRSTSTTNTWLAANTPGLTSGVKLCATSGATFYITGVQLEAGSVATPFERRPYGTELALCQRYFQIISSGIAGGDSNNNARAYWFFKTTMRATPTFTAGAGSQGTTGGNSPDFWMYSNPTYTVIGAGSSVSAEL